jgi:outer membrane protein assembly factor BamE (lipoprotein component of BamABCDE complex)
MHPVPNSEDRQMKKARLLLVAVLASLAVSACSASSTSPNTCVDPGGNSYYCE